MHKALDLMVCEKKEHQWGVDKMNPPETVENKAKQDMTKGQTSSTASDPIC